MANPAEAPSASNSAADLPDPAATRLRAVAFASTTVSFLVTDPARPDNPIVDANAAFERMTGWGRDEVLGRNCRILQGPGTDAAAVARVRAAVGEGREITETLLNYRKDGTPFWNELHIAPVRDEAGRITNFVGVQTDVSERLEAEAERRRNARFVERIAAASPAILYVYDLTGERNVYANKRIEEVLGYSAEEIQALGETFLPSLLHPDDLARLPAIRMQEGAADGEVFEFEFRMRHADGGWRCLATRETPFERDAGGRVRQLAGAALDVTEQKAAADRLRAAKEAAEEASRLKSGFLATMSHELRTPLTAIVGYADLLLAGQIEPEAEADVSQILRSATHLRALVDDLLDLSRIEAGRIDLAREEVDLAALVEQVVADFAPQAAGNGLGVVVATPPGALLVRADRLRLRQVVTNLVGNAVKFTTAGSVRVSVRETAGAAEIAVADTGIGIAPALLPLIFDEFWQADSSTTRTYGGSGLGLAIARRLVEAHGGEIEVESEPGVGSTFTVGLPIPG